MDIKSDFKHGDPERAGILLLNLGTPQAPTAGAVRTYLAQFLSDRRVVEAPRWLWWLVLHGIILRLRPRRVARLYASVWTDAGSPLLAFSRRLTAALDDLLTSRGHTGVVVELAMTYGQPDVAGALARLADQNVRKLLVVPLFPQYSATTTAAAFDAVAEALGRVRWLPELRFVNDYHDHPQYIDALADSVRRHQREQGQPDLLLASFHGIPQRYFAAGDPYHCQCHASARLLSNQLELTPRQFALGFQSRFGREPWLAPYTDHLLAELPARGATHVQVVCPGFAVDCLETLEEIALQNRAIFERAGGKQFSYVPALNDHPDHARLLASLGSAHSAGWPQWSDRYSEQQATEAAQAARQRALDMGAPQ